MDAGCRILQPQLARLRQSTASRPGPSTLKDMRDSCPTIAYPSARPTTPSTVARWIRNARRSPGSREVSGDVPAKTLATVLQAPHRDVILPSRAWLVGDAQAEPSEQVRAQLAQASARILAQDFLGRGEAPPVHRHVRLVTIRQEVQARGAVVLPRPVVGSVGRDTPVESLPSRKLVPAVVGAGWHRGTDRQPEGRPTNGRMTSFTTSTSPVLPSQIRSSVSLATTL